MTDRDRLEALAQELHEWLWEEPCMAEREKGVAVGFEDGTLYAARRIREILAELATETSLASEPPDELRRRYPASHGYTPSTSPFASGEGCRVMLARYPCNYRRDQHDPDLPPVDLDVFGYRRAPRPCCPGEGSMAHVRGCVNHPEAER